jgi:hypothetical protein
MVAFRERQVAALVEPAGPRMTTGFSPDLARWAWAGGGAMAPHPKASRARLAAKNVLMLCFFNVHSFAKGYIFPIARFDFPVNN